MIPWTLRIIETPEEMEAAVALQRVVWPGSETEIVPGHLMLTAVHNGGLLIAAYDQEPTSSFGELEGQLDHSAAPMIGLVFGLPGFTQAPGGLRLKHNSHLLAVHPAYRSQGLGFALKRAQWQMVRRQGLALITWTYDPLLSRNAYLNVSRLGGVCSAYVSDAYGVLKDELNAGLPSDRFVVDWWINSGRVVRRLSKRARQPLDLADYLAAGVEIVNRTTLNPAGWARPGAQPELDLAGGGRPEMLLVEIPADFSRLRAAEPELALAWRLHSRSLFESLFAAGYLVTDFIYLPSAGAPGGELDSRRGRSFYVLSHGESTL